MGKTYWFRAKRHGWGWGLPAAWQGWLVLSAYIVLVAVGVLWLFAGAGIAVILLYNTVLASGYLAVCWVKGDDPGGGRGVAR